MANNRYPHYRKSKAAMDNWDPLYQSQFKIMITPPPVLSAGWNLVMESIKSISGLEPSGDYIGDSQTQEFFGHTVRHAPGTMAGHNTHDINISFNVNLDDDNSAYVLKTLRKWCDLIFDPLTGKMGMKKDYVGGPMVVSAHNKQGEIYRQWSFPTVWPGAKLPVQDFDYNEDGIYNIDDWTLFADVWDETIR